MVVDNFNKINKAILKKAAKHDFFAINTHTFGSKTNKSFTVIK